MSHSILEKAATARNRIAQKNTVLVLVKEGSAGKSVDVSVARILSRKT